MEVLKHYLRREVAEEVFRYSRHRWVALEGRLGGGRVFIRYDNGKPLTINSPDHVSEIIRRHLGIGVRTIYVTAASWKVLGSKDDVEDASNIIKYTPFWDIDIVEGGWRIAVEVADELVNVLRSEGIERSVYLLWSGNGIHVRINENSISDECLTDLKLSPVDAAYALVEYVLRKYSERLKARAKSSGGVVKIENLIDVKRVFTAPLSLHRELNRVAVCFSPDELSSFNIEWTEPGSFKHSSCWGVYDPGETDQLVKEAIKFVGALGRHSRIASAELAVRKARPKRLTGIGRFQVMGLLQAARYYLIYGDMNKAKSFGLNRAIFYAWAKRRGQVASRRLGMGQVSRSKSSVSSKEGARLIEAAGEEAFVSPTGYFTMGGQEQRPEDYDRQIAERINAVIPYEKAWKAALNYLRKFPRNVLTDPRKFYEKVYKPVRDNFELVLEGEAPSSLERGEREGKGEGLLKFVKREGK